MEQLYYLYNYSIENRRYERHIGIVTMSTAIQASIDYIDDVEDWRSCGDLKTVGKFTSDPLEIELTYESYICSDGEKEYESCIYSLKEVDMTYIGLTNV